MEGLRPPQIQALIEEVAVLQGGGPFHLALPPP